MSHLELSIVIAHIILRFGGILVALLLLLQIDCTSLRRHHVADAPAVGGGELRQGAGREHHCSGTLTL